MSQILFPAFVYKSPGEHRHPRGGTYKYVPAYNQSDLDKFLADGWFLTASEAVAAFGFVPKNDPRLAKKRKPSQPLDGINRRLLKAQQEKKPDISPEESVIEQEQNSAPTRAELEEKANELGIHFDKKTTDKIILNRINKKLDQIKSGE